MEAGLIVQYTVIALAVVFSAAYVARRQFPAAVRKLRIALAVSVPSSAGTNEPVSAATAGVST